MDMEKKPDGSPPDLPQKANLCIFEVLIVEIVFCFDCASQVSAVLLMLMTKLHMRWCQKLLYGLCAPA